MKSKKVDIDIDEKKDSQLRKDRVAFCAELYYSVMKDNPANAKKWVDWATIALHYFETYEARYLENLEINHVLKGKWRPTISYLNNQFTRSDVTTYLAEMGVWIYQEKYQGVRLARTMVEVEASHRQILRQVRGRSDKTNYRALEMMKHSEVDLPILTVQALLPQSS